MSEQPENRPEFFYEIDQGTGEWFDIRKWVTSWSEMKSALWWPVAMKTHIFKKIAEKYVDDTALPPGYDFEDIHLLEKIVSGSSLSAIDKMKRWNELENYVMRFYEKISGNKVLEVWFVKLNEDVWCSPDWLIISDDEKYFKWVFEAKCPLGPNFVRYLYDWGIPKEYIPQAVNYFICIPEIEFVDFCIFHPWASKELNHFHKRTVYRKDVLMAIETATAKLKKCNDKKKEIEETLLSKYTPNEKIEPWKKQ